MSDYQGFTKPAITRLARRAGVKSMSDDCVDVVRSMIALKLDEMQDRDTLELVNASMNNPRRVFVYRRLAKFEILNGGE